MVDGGELKARLDPAIAEMGVRVLSAHWSGRKLVVRVEHGDASSPALDEIAQITPVISELLDRILPGGGEPYELEVSSPGLERELYLPEHYLFAVGGQVTAKLADGGGVSGVLVAATVQQLSIEEAGEVRTVPISEIRSASTRFEWGGATKGRSQGRGRSQVDGKG